MHTGRFDGFVLVSSDSDFARLASRLREQGLQVFGIGKRNTPEAFRKACKRFIFVENLLGDGEALRDADGAGQSEPVGDAPGAREPVTPHQAGHSIGSANAAGRSGQDRSRGDGAKAARRQRLFRSSGLQCGATTTTGSP